MALESNRDSTFPHDYRLICAGRDAPTVVGGQAVNLWAISYLERKTVDLRAEAVDASGVSLLRIDQKLAHIISILESLGVQL